MITVDEKTQQLDEALKLLAEYTHNYQVDSSQAYDTARWCLADTLGCGILALKYPACSKLLGPLIPDATVASGARVPGTCWMLDPFRAAFNIGTMIRWLDFNDTWLAAEWGHPSDNLGGLLALCDYLSRNAEKEGKPALTVRDLLTAMIKAHEIQGGLALQNSFNRLGFDHVILVKVASTAVCAQLLGLNEEQIADAISQAWIDCGPLRTYRHAPNTGSRKSWAAGDATSRGLQLAWMTKQGEMGYSTALSAEKWGFNDVILGGKTLQFEQELSTYVMENVLFKISFPAEFHAQTAVEAAIKLHPSVSPRLDEIEEILIETHESAVRIIDKKGPLHNPADRDHCLQYMAAVGLLHGNLTADHYEDDAAADPRIDELRNKMRVVEKQEYTLDYLNPEKRSIANAMTVRFKDGTSSNRIEVEYPIGHKRRRQEGIPVLFQKFKRNMLTRFSSQQVEHLMELFQDPERLDSMPVYKLTDLLQGPSVSFSP